MLEIYAMPGHLIRRLHQISTQVFQKHVQEAGFDITSVQFAAMGALRANPGIEQAQIAALIGYDRATIGGVIDRLEQKGYVTRVISKRDRRAREVRLTETGETLSEALLPVVLALQQDILGNLDVAEREAFTKLAAKAVGGSSSQA